MSEVEQPVQDTPVAAPATTEPAVATTTAAEANTDPVRNQESGALAPESRPELTDGTTAAAPTAANVTPVTKEEKLGNGEVAVTSQPINEGVLNYKGPGLKGLIFSKKYFWFSDAPLEHKHLTAYLGNEKSKDIGHANAAHANQTGKGLMFFAKRAEDKEHPQGMFNLADISDVAKGNFNDFTFMLHGHKHTFQAVTKAEKDGWLVAIETKHADAKTEREEIVGSDGYKSALEKYGASGASATTGTTRSLSRPKKASKSRERKAAPTTNGTTSDAVADTNAGTTAGTTAENTPETVADKSTHAETGEAVAGGAATGAVAGAAAGRHGSISDEEKKNKKSRSQSRNKRGSIFGNLLGKKEEHDAKKDAKKEEKKEEKEEKEIKAEEKAEKKEINAEVKAEKKEEKAEKRELKEEKHLEKEGNPMATGATHGFNAHAVAARVIGADELPASRATDGATDAAPVAATEPLAAETTATGTARETAPKPNKRNSLFGGFFGKKETTSPAATETAPALVAKDEPSTVSETAPQLDDPVAEPTAAPAVDNTATPAAATADTTSPVSNTTPTGNRRTSFFSNIGTKKERKAGATSDTEVTDGETKKSSGFGGLLRKASRAQGKNTNASGIVKEPTSDVPSTMETPVGSTTDGAAEAEKPATTEGETGTNAMTESHEQTPMSAAA